LNAKRVYPYWKMCPYCGSPFSVMDSDEYHKKTHCCQWCATETSRWKRRGFRGSQSHPYVGPLKPRKGSIIVCPVCGTEKFKPASWLKSIKIPTCSRRCNGMLRIKTLIPHSHKGHLGWTPEGIARIRASMTGPNNPSWKGGVTYFRKKGNYKPIKYVRCPPVFHAMARKDGYVMEHRLMVAQEIGRPLLRVEVVHHEDHNPQNNVLTNFLLFASNRAHKLYEARGYPPPLWQLSPLSTTEGKSGACVSQLELF
jgi:hypothetical protein